MNWEIFWSVLFALLVAMSLFTFVFLATHRKKADELLRITLADYEDFLRGERHVKECEDAAGDKYPESNDYFNALKAIRGLHYEYRQTLTGEDFSVQIADGKRLQEKFMGDDK